MRTVSILLVEWRGIRWKNCEFSDRVSGCKENVRRNVRYLIELMSCKENVRRNLRYLIELRVVRSLLEELRGIR